ncbi:MAG: O-antigen ligase family protein [Bacteroidota bacterium]
MGLVPYFAIFLVLLSARMQLLILALLLSISLIFWMYQQRQLLKGLMVAGSMAILAGVFFLAVPSTSYRFKALVEKIRSGETANIRIDIWQAAWPVVEESWSKGLGTGDVQMGLDKAYVAVDLEVALNKHLNAHNQYLQTTLALGILGLGVWIFLLFQSFLAAYRTHFYLLQWFLWLFTLSCLTESMLETQRGILFFGFIGTMLIAYHPPYEQPFSWPNRSKEQRQERRLARKNRRHR